MGEVYRLDETKGVQGVTNKKRSTMEEVKSKLEGLISMEYIS